MASKKVAILLVLSLGKCQSFDQDFCQWMPKEGRNFLQWANALPVLAKQDEKASKIWRKSWTFENTFDSVRRTFYEMTATTFQTECAVVKKFGGKWNADYGEIYGHKTVCMDKLYYDVIKGECLVYSFGVGSEFSFELAMAELGCKVRAFDFHVNTTDQDFTSHPNIVFTMVGLSHYRGMREMADGAIRQQVTLLDAKQMMGDEGKTISFLKVDVEGAEIFAIRNWIDDGLTEQISQMQIEFHTGREHIKKPEVVETLTDLIGDLRDLYKLGFRSISYEANAYTGKHFDFDKQTYNNFFDLVFYKKS